jgi:hypothetical protein
MKFTKKSLMTVALIILFIGGVLIAACAPRQAAPDDDSSSAGGTGDDVGAEMVVEWSPEINCATCHVDEDGSLAVATTAAGIHKSEDLSCIDCHDNQTGLADVHKGVTAGETTSKVLKKTKVTTETCTASGCHDNAEERVAATSSFAGLTDINGTMINPHDLPQGDGHKSLNCSTCHKGHEPFVADDTVKECYSCHHEKVFECQTCHE